MDLKCVIWCETTQAYVVSGELHYIYIIELLTQLEEFNSLKYFHTRVAFGVNIWVCGGAAGVSVALQRRRMYKPWLVSADEIPIGAKQLKRAPAWIFSLIYLFHYIQQPLCWNDSRHSRNEQCYIHGPGYFELSTQLRQPYSLIMELIMGEAQFLFATGLKGITDESVMKQVWFRCSHLPYLLINKINAGFVTTKAAT